MAKPLDGPPQSMIGHDQQNLKFRDFERRLLRAHGDKAVNKT